MALVNIIVRSDNNIDHIEHTLNMIKRQSFTDYDLINLDIGSIDGTLEMIKKYNGKVISVSRDDYHPGKILNGVIRKCKGEIVVFNDANCIPRNEYWLENLIRPLLGNTDVVAVYGREIPAAGLLPLVNMGRNNNPVSMSSGAIIRKYLKSNPFDPQIRYLEDLEWVMRMRQLGYQINYVADAEVECFFYYRLFDVSKLFYHHGLAKGRIYGFKSSFWGGFFGPFVNEVVNDFAFLLLKGYILRIPLAFVFRYLQRYSEWKGRLDFFRD